MTLSRLWPTHEQYQTALQNPHVCFSDPALKSARVTLDTLGLPRLVSGGFACVCRVHDQAGEQHAVRLFVKSPPSGDQLNNISGFLSQRAEACFVDFEYQEDGIRIDGQAYPLVRMQWVEGRLFGRYVEECVRADNVAALRNLRGQWLFLLATLDRLDVAHGDLQNGNVIVAPDGSLRLIDYDGMFVPALAGERSLVLGLPDYQHPERLAADFDKHLDVFSGLLILTSLLALERDPSLWDRHNNGENLLFTKKDLVNPSSSLLINDLYGLGDPETKECVDVLTGWARQPHLPVPSVAANLYDRWHRRAGSMFAASLQDFTDALGVPAGRRPVSAELDGINKGEIVPCPGSRALHWGAGQNAVVFRCRPTRGLDMALRCSLRPPVSDALERAVTVDRYLQGLPDRPKSFVRYRFVADAVFAANAWRGAYLMDWVGGETLLDVIRQRVARRDATGLRQLSDKLAHMVNEMQAAGVAHGDLYHGHIMVLPDGEVRFVDYDAAYVPPLNGRVCLTAGREGYAHSVYGTSAALRPFNVHMDTFAALVLITSLYAIAQDHSTFRGATEDCLLFRVEDLRNPVGSPVFLALADAGDVRLKDQANSLRAMCLDPALAQVPLSQVAGVPRERQKAPGPRIHEPALPPRPKNWKVRPLVAPATFHAIFQSEAQSQS